MLRRTGDVDRIRFIGTHRRAEERIGTLLTSRTKFFAAVELLPRKEPKAPIRSAVFEVLTIESDETGIDGTYGEINQNISKTAISTILEGFD